MIDFRQGMPPACLSGVRSNAGPMWEDPPPKRSCAGSTPSGTSSSERSREGLLPGEAYGNSWGGGAVSGFFGVPSYAVFLRNSGTADPARPGSPGVGTRTDGSLLCFRGAESGGAGRLLRGLRRTKGIVLFRGQRRGPGGRIPGRGRRALAHSGSILPEASGKDREPGLEY